MHRFYVNQRVQELGQTVTLSREESEHAARVLRLREGQSVHLLDGEGLYEAKLSAVSTQETSATVTAILPSPEASAKAVLLQGLPKADKLEMIVQKATELGAWALWPVEMERSIARAERDEKGNKKRERLARIALEAAKQSGRAHVPEIFQTLAFDQAVELISKSKDEDGYDAVFVAWEEERALPLSEAVKTYVRERGTPRRVLLVVGPEGGISQSEWKRLKDLGAVSVTLGRRILRTETAGLCALAVLWAALGEM
ncbi:MAG: RsmE family RNA methyltransferase [Clostridia bacterium]